MVVIAAAIVIAGSAPGAQTGGQQAGDEAAVRQLPQKYEAAWNARNVQQILDLYTDDALVVEPTGEVRKGRSALEASYKESFGDMGNAKLSLDVDTVRFLGPDTVVFTGTSTIAGGKQPPGSDSGHYMVIAKKVGGEWKASEVHIAVTPPQPQPEAAGTAGRSEAAAEAEVKAVGDRWMKAMMDRDAAALDRIYAEDYTFVDPSGRIMTRDEDINDIKSGKLKFESHDHSNVQTRIYGDTAVVTGISTIKGTYEVEDISGQYRWTDTFVRRNGEWKVVASQVTRIVDEAQQKKK